MPDSPTPSHPGAAAVTRLGDYELLEQLGEGGMGVVFKARQRGLDRLVAVKVMNLTALAKGEEARKRFLREARAMAKLEHPNIVSIHEISEDSGVVFFSMRLIEGGSLATQIDRFGHDLKASAALVAAVARALDHAHRRCVVHRDLKPSNILIDSEGNPHVTDFGIAKLIEGDTELTSTGRILGTPEYMSPEQATGGAKRAQAPADIFSLGVLFYRLLTGRLPFHGQTDYETIQQIIEKPPEPPSVLSTGVDSGLESICMKCLEKEPKNRYSSAKALADELDRWREMVPPTKPSPSTSRQKTQVVSQSPSKLIRIILADDHPIVRKGIRAELESFPGVQVVAEASDGHEALQLAGQHHPDLVVMDISMRGLNGLEATARITRELPNVRVVIMSMHTDPNYFWAALRAGASGYLLKKSATAELKAALERVLGGEIYLSREISECAVKQLPLQQAAYREKPSETLTERQREILQLIAEGRTTKDIALSLKVSPKTVEHHRARLMGQLGVHDIPGLVRTALAQGLIVAVD